MSYENPAQPAPPVPTPAADAVPLWAPLYGASFGAAVKRFFSKYADFSGRASRSEFWWAYLFFVIVNAVIQIIGLVFGGSAANIDSSGNVSFGAGFWVSTVISLIWFVATVVPWLALVWRRLHDANFAGPFYFLVLIPFVGAILVFIFTLLPSNPEGARFDRPRA
ncbi:DUF805 domain-containing protein [Leifsonia aquatica]|uniref:DUF805 domain-containing protein n=1 Tax=Leifsonia aquatica TaxID=144185 RepID=UPI00046AC1C9|nr:DUF805 domain-containing protein [Leifsonia aquatica]